MGKGSACSVSQKNITLIHIICLRGESVSKEFTASKRHEGSSSEIEDKFDQRVCCQVQKATVDLINVTFARNVSKGRHRKLSREAKNSVDQLYNSPFLSNHTKRSINGHCIQIFGVDGQMSQVKLVDDGSYVVRWLGSLRLPTCGSDMHKARILLEQLMEMKKMTQSNRDHYFKMVNNKTIKSKPMNQWQRRDRSSYQMWMMNFPHALLLLSLLPPTKQIFPAGFVELGFHLPKGRTSSTMATGPSIFSSLLLLCALIQLNCILVLFSTDILSTTKFY